MKSDVTSPRKDATKSQEFLKNVVQLDDDDGETDRNQYCGGAAKMKKKRKGTSNQRIPVTISSLTVVMMQPWKMV